MAIGGGRVSLRSVLVVTGLVLGLGGGEEVWGQISPGKLSSAHADLEGSGSCLECHAQRKGVDGALCLDCHDLLRQRIDAGLGLHSRADYEECATCHIEHHGREFELVWWREEGEASFDHALAGYDLLGAHDRASCRDCHRPESITAARELTRRRKDLSRTFLGLEPACLGCHQDEHRGQTESDGCLSCHAMEAWMPASLFDHDRSRYALTGRHRDLGCGECHARIDVPEAAGETYLSFTVPAFGQCSDCHQDPHQGRLGSGCTECHGTTGWRSTELGAFNHDRTRFGLLGRHRGLDCKGCHKAGQSMRIERFESCRDCHGDTHLGQFDARADGGLCESCHEVRGFRPSTFALEEHQKTNYPIEGAHLAVPCVACHRQIEAGRLAEILGAQAGRQMTGTAMLTRFRFPSTSCRDCHADPHRDEVSALVDAGGCESCHSLAGWRGIDFDHDRTDFPLRDGHVGPVCGDCHESAEAPVGEAWIRLSEAPTACSGCHSDPHLGQFLDAAGEVACERCHQVKEWKTVRFDHQVDSVFPLDGAHRRVDCLGCHPREAAEEGPVVRYKPLATRCESCHAGEPTGAAGAS